MKWIYDASGNADLEEVAFAERGISAILEHVDLSSAPRDAADAATCLLGRLVMELVNGRYLSISEYYSVFVMFKNLFGDL